MWLARLIWRFIQWLPVSSSRNIFQFHDGSRWRRVDPIVIDRQLNAELPDWKAAIDLLVIPTDLAGGMPDDLLQRCIADRDKALAKLVGLVRSVFGVNPIGDDGSGLSEAECLNLLADFVSFTWRLVEAAGPFSNWPAPVEASQPALATVPPAASISAENEFSTSKPG